LEPDGKEKSEMARKTVDFNKGGIGKLQNDKPVVYRILTPSGKNNYTGTAQRGRVQDRLLEHLPNGKDYIPGRKVQIEQTSSIDEARAKEARIITRTEPPYNKQGK
jgi:hypothetical protein